MTYALLLVLAQASLAAHIDLDTKITVNGRVISNQRALVALESSLRLESGVGGYEVRLKTSDEGEDIRLDYAVRDAAGAVRRARIVALPGESAELAVNDGAETLRVEVLARRR